MDVAMDPTETGPLPDKLDRSHELFIVQTVFLILAGVCVILRAIVKTFVVKLNSLDDYLIYGAMVGFLLYTIFPPILQTLTYIDVSRPATWPTASSL